MAVAAKDIVIRRMREVAELVSNDPKWADGLFHQSFAVEKIVAVGKQSFASVGRITDVRFLHSSSKFAGRCHLVAESDQLVPLDIGLDPKAPHQLLSAWFGNPTPRLKNLGDAAEEIAKLPGATSFGIWNLGPDQPEVLASHDPDRALAIGSAFKLYVLGTLAREVADGKRALDNVVTLKKEWRSMPSGEMQSWPDRTPVTLQTLAAIMISISDNTATDHLLFTLGRAEVESMLAPMGNTNASRNAPLPSTGEMFRMKGTNAGIGADEFAKLDTAKKRDMLAMLDQQPLDEQSYEGYPFPCHVDDVEWFASASDLCRAMDWLRRATESGRTTPLREVLAINPGAPALREVFSYVGFKGGSEPGVLNRSFLLRAKNGEWYAASAGWNDPKEALAGERLANLMETALYMLGEATNSSLGASRRCETPT